MDGEGVFIGKGVKDAFLDLRLANRHGLISGATGTGKTVTLQILAEGFARAGVPVVLSDVKGDLSGICQPGADKPFLRERAEAIGLEGYGPDVFPVVFWDLFGKQGHPVRTTISEMGPLLLARLLELNDTQEGVLNIAFRVADDEGLLLLDLKDLRALLVFVAENARELGAAYGNISPASVGAIQRRLLVLETQGAKNFFGEPALNLADFLRCDEGGRGFINVLAADKLMQAPRLYGTFLLWLLSELFEDLPETGDPEKPKLVFFFDEAHLLFRDAPRSLVDKVEQVVRLIRSKGVGVYFVTQNPTDVPDAVLGQLGNRFLHALRAYTPRDRKAVRAAGDTFRQNPAFAAADVIPELGIGEALVSTLTKKGVPSVVQRILIRPPASRLGPAKPAERRAVLAGSPVAGIYDTAVDRRSAYEILDERAAKMAQAAEAQREAEAQRKAAAARAKPAPRRSNRQGAGEAFLKSTLRSIGRVLGRELVRGILGSLRR